MNSCITRRCFFKTTAAGLVSTSAALTLAQRLSVAVGAEPLGLKTKVRIGKIYLGHAHPGWPMTSVDLDAEVKRYEAEMAKMPGLGDVEFIDGGLVSNPQQLAAAKEKFKDVSGILVLHLTMGVTGYIEGLMATGLPVMIYAQPYSGHEWHIVGGWQRQGRLVDVLPSSRFEDIAEAIRPFRAIHRLRETRILHVSQGDADPKYCKVIKDKFGTEIISLKLPDLEKAYKEAGAAECQADADRWIREAAKIVEPSKEDILKGATMYIAMKNLLAQHQAQAITMNCLGMGLVDRNMGYPCLGFVRFNNQLLAGVCEADLKSTMTQLMFTYLVGRTGFVTDPVFDYSNNTIIHAHCVAATQMEGPQTKPSPYHIRTHLEDGRGVSLMVKMPVGGKISMARLIGTDNMLFSTGEAVDSPMVERGCRSKLTMRVDNPERILENWSCGLHRVIFYGDHTRDLTRYCRFMKIRLLREGQDDLQNVPGLEWETHVHA
jgi:L-fucose isomerase-like protein